MNRPILSIRPRQGAYRLYSTSRWQRLREQQLWAEPLCAFCRERGEKRAATVCDHETPHKGDEQRFWEGPFMSLCRQCHDSDKRRIEHGNKPRPNRDADGWPI